MKKYILICFGFFVFLSSHNVIAQDDSQTKKDKVINLGGVEINLSTAAKTSKVIDFIRTVTGAEISEIDSVLQHLAKAEKKTDDSFIEELPESVGRRILISKRKIFEDASQAGQPQAGQPQAGQPQAGQPQAGQPQAGQPQAGQPQAGQPQAGQPQAGQPQAGQPQAGQPQAGQPQAGQPQAGQPQAGQPQEREPEVSPKDLNRLRIIINDNSNYFEEVAENSENEFGLTPEIYALIKATESDLRNEFDKNKNQIVVDTLSNMILPKIDSKKIFKIVESIKYVKKVSGREDFFNDFNFSNVKPPVQISLGANFNFINGLNTNAIYAEVSGFPTEIWRPWEDEFDHFGKFGLDLGLLNYRSVSRIDSIIDLRPDTLFIPVSEVDTQKTRIVSKAEKVYESSQENLGVYFTPTFKLTKYLYFAIHTEYRKIDVTQTIFKNIVESDTNIVNKKELSFEEENKRPINTTQRLENKFTKNETQLGGGILVFIDDDPFKLKIKFIVGYQIVTRRNRPKEEVFFHNLNFSLIEGNLGVKVGGQLRGEFFSGKPEFSVYLAKEFPVSKLLDFLGPN